MSAEQMEIHLLGKTPARAKGWGKLRGKLRGT